MVARPPYAPPWLDMRDYRATVVTVPGPTSAPSLTNVVGFGGNYVAGSTYDVACTYEGWTGETQLGPAATFVASTDRGLAALPVASVGTRAPTARFYIRKDGGTYRLAQHAYAARPKRCGFGDEGPSGGLVIPYDASGATAPVSNTAVDQDGTVIANPTSAPLLFTYGALPPATTYYGAYAYVCEDGTETALSPISAGVATNAVSGSSMHVRVGSPPSGGVFVNVYLGTSASAGAMKLQLANQPLGRAHHQVHSFNASGAAPSAGAAQSTISAFQQMLDVLDDNGGCGIVPSGTHVTKVPLIMRGFFGRVLGLAAHDLNGSSSPVRVSYTGTLSGVDLLVFCGQSWKVENIDFADPNSRVANGLHFADFTGGGAFTSIWNGCTWSAMAAGGRGLAVDVQSSFQAGNHTASEQYFSSCSFNGKQWGIDLHGNQTQDFRFRDLTTYCSPSGANSGDIRNAGPVLLVDGWNSGGHGQYLLCVSVDATSNGSSSTQSVDIRGLYAELTTVKQIVWVSPMIDDIISAAIRGSRAVNQSGTPLLALYGGGVVIFELGSNPEIDGNVLLVHARAVLYEVGKSGLGGAYKATATNYRYGLVPMTQPVLATGAAHTADDIITTLQTLGLVKQA